MLEKSNLVHNDADGHEDEDDDGDDDDGDDRQTDRQTDRQKHNNNMTYDNYLTLCRRRRQRRRRCMVVNYVPSLS
jgi:TATA-binding protein-associated factor Taf7